jgi:hypothetical protein
MRKSRSCSSSHALVSRPGKNDRGQRSDRPCASPRFLGTTLEWRSFIQQSPSANDNLNRVRRRHLGIAA